MRPTALSLQKLPKLSRPQGAGFRFAFVPLCTLAMQARHRGNLRVSLPRLDELPTATLSIATRSPSRSRIEFRATTLAPVVRSIFTIPLYDPSNFDSIVRFTLLNTIVIKFISLRFLYPWTLENLLYEFSRTSINFTTERTSEPNDQLLGQSIVIKQETLYYELGRSSQKRHRQLGRHATNFGISEIIGFNSFSIRC